MSGGFMLAGIDASEFGVELIGGTKINMLPDTRDMTVVVPGIHGAYDFGGTLGPKLFELRCAMRGARSPAELQSRIRKFAAHLLDVRGEPRTVSLTLAVEPDKTYRVRYAGSLPLEDIISVGVFTLPLVAYDPHAYGEEQVVEQTITASPEGITITSEGNVATPPVIVLINEGTNTINGFTIRYYEEIEEE